MYSSTGLEATSVSIRCFGKDWYRRESGERHCLEWSLEDVDGIVVADLYLLGSVGTGCGISKLWKGVLTQQKMRLLCRLRQCFLHFFGEIRKLWKGVTKI